MFVKKNILRANIKYYSNKNESSQQFFENVDSFLFVNDCIKKSGYFAIGAKASISVDLNANINFEELDLFINKENEWKFGFLSYDIKNEIEDLQSDNNDALGFPILNFFIPETLLEYKNGLFTVVYGNPKYLIDAEALLNAHQVDDFEEVDLKSSLTKDQYLKKIELLQNEIKAGNIYEVNFCYEFFADKITINPLALYKRLMFNSNAPFSSFGKFDDKYIISASPERFMKKTGDKLISQPIKGTAKRGETKEEDENLKNELAINEKERSENIMIVDLVRNDFSKIANFDSVLVEELCKIYTFKTVHQMISTIACELKANVSFSDILKATFPMGSMTGAPKISAMQLIEQEEETKRGLYSGSVGFVKPNGDFDFNVIIRSFLYNKTNKYLSAMVGGAITAKSSPVLEYEETLIKVSALLKSLKK